MKKKEKSRQLFNMLKKHAKLQVDLSLTSLNRLSVSETDILYGILKNKSRKKEGAFLRPCCPIGLHHSIGRESLNNYKIAMANYISQWGITFLNPSTVVTSLFEALADHLENHDLLRRVYTC